MKGQMKVDPFSCLLICCCYVVRSKFFITLSLGHLSIVFGLTLFVSMEKISVFLKMFCSLRLACEDLLLTVKPKAPGGCIKDLSSKELIILLKQTEQYMCSFHSLPNFCAFTLIASQRVVLRF
jgi:hypothetical protein